MYRHPVTDGNPRKARSVRIRRRRTRGSVATAKNVRANHEETVSIDGLTRPHDLVPPTSTIAGRLRTGNVRIGGQRMRNQNRVVPLAGQGSKGLESDVKLGELSPHLQPERLAANIEAQ